MLYHDVKFIGSAVMQSQWPATELPEIVFAGRSNAGKSSLINSLVNRANLAYTGKTPGKTRMLNFFEVDNMMVFADAPGYGYAAGSQRTFEDFAGLMDPYFENRKNLKAVILVLDIRRVPNDDDMTMVRYAQQAHLPLLAVCTKGDKLSRNQQIRQLGIITKTLGIRKESAVVTSSLKKTGMEDVWDLISRSIGISQDSK